MDTIRATYKVVTPLFSSRADQEKFGLSAASFKGVLRFWWRALVYGRYSGDLSKIRKRENELFGSTDTGQGSFLLKIQIPQKTLLGKDEVLCPPGSRSPVGPGSRYLGYGIMEAFGNRDGTKKSGQLLRPCLMPSATLEIVLASRCSIDQEVLDALKLLGLLGGLGSRSRRGWGSVSLFSLTKCQGTEKNGESIWEPPKNLNEYETSLENIFKNYALTGNNLPDYTAFSKGTRITKVIEGKCPFELLNQMGERMQKFRSWGFKNHAGEYKLPDNSSAEQNFKDDHDLAYEFAETNSINAHPKRVTFGLPSNYNLSNVDDRKKKKLNIVSSSFERRASPFFIHLHEFGENDCKCITTIFPSVFLPETERIKMFFPDTKKPNPNNLVSIEVDQKIEYNEIHKFIDGFNGHREQKDIDRPYFPGKKDLSWKGTR